jgi:hypothetical protein
MLINPDPYFEAEGPAKLGLFDHLVERFDPYVGKFFAIHSLCQQRT